MSKIRINETINNATVPGHLGFIVDRDSDSFTLLHGSYLQNSEQYLSEAINYDLSFSLEFSCNNDAWQAKMLTRRLLAPFVAESGYQKHGINAATSCKWYSPKAMGIAFAFLAEHKTELSLVCITKNPLLVPLGLIEKPLPQILKTMENNKEAARIRQKECSKMREKTKNIEQVSEIVGAINAALVSGELMGVFGSHFLFDPAKKPAGNAPAWEALYECRFREAENSFYPELMRPLIPMVGRGCFINGYWLMKNLTHRFVAHRIEFAEINQSVAMAPIFEAIKNIPAIASTDLPICLRPGFKGFRASVNRQFFPGYFRNGQRRVRLSKDESLAWAAICFDLGVSTAIGRQDEIDDLVKLVALIESRPEPIYFVYPEEATSRDEGFCGAGDAAPISQERRSTLRRTLDWIHEKTAPPDDKAPEQ